MNDLKPIYEIMTAWNDQLIRHDKIRRLREAVMVCDTFGELHNLISANIDFLVDNPPVLEMFELSIKRIRGIRRESRLSWRTLSN
jgi:hypothetical protein